MKKYLIRLDLEGVSGIISYEQATPGNADYAEGRRLFMGDLLAAIDGLFEGGADEIYLYDEHCSAVDEEKRRLSDGFIMDFTELGIV